MTSNLFVLVKEHIIELIVAASNATLQILDKTEKRSLVQQSGRYLQISGDEPIYIGGVPNSMRERISIQLGHVKNASSLRGCLSSLYVNSRMTNLAHDLDYSHKIIPGCGLKSVCSGASNEFQQNKTSPCMNGGNCIEKLTFTSEFVCECPHEFTGILCETPIKLSGSGGLKYRALPLVDSNTRYDKLKEFSNIYLQLKLYSL